MQSYLNLLRDIVSTGEPHMDRTGVGTTSVFGCQWRHDMRMGFPLLTTKKLPFRWVAEELFWFLSGSSDESKLRATGVDIWKEWATAEQCAKFGRSEQQMGLIYGPLWRSFPVGESFHDESPQAGAYIDQIAQLMHDVVETPNSRRLIVTGWHPHYQKRVTLPPCHTLWQVRVHESSREVSLHLYARSVDAFLGLPFNIASYGLLLSLIAAASYMEPRELIISFGDLHVYSNHLEQVREQLTRAPRLLPTLHINREGSGLEYLTGCKYEDLRLDGYDPHPAIKALVAI